jgi:hypothetical protein
MSSKASMLFQRITAAFLISLIVFPTAPAQEPGNSESVRVNVDFVRVPVSVTQRGVPVKGLTMDTFQLRENSTPQVGSPEESNLRSKRNSRRSDGVIHCDVMRQR